MHVHVRDAGPLSEEETVRAVCVWGGGRGGQKEEPGARGKSGGEHAHCPAVVAAARAHAHVKMGPVVPCTEVARPLQ